MWWWDSMNNLYIDDVIFLDFLAKRSRDSSGDADVAPENPASACKMHCLHMCICMNDNMLFYAILLVGIGRNENTSKILKVLHRITIYSYYITSHFLLEHSCAIWEDKTWALAYPSVRTQIAGSWTSIRYDHWLGPGQMDVHPNTKNTTEGGSWIWSVDRIMIYYDIFQPPSLKTKWIKHDVSPLWFRFLSRWLTATQPDPPKKDAPLGIEALPCDSPGQWGYPRTRDFTAGLWPIYWGRWCNGGKTMP